jgi:hypothetical protein
VPKHRERDENVGYVNLAYPYVDSEEHMPLWVPGGRVYCASCRCGSRFLLLNGFRE